MSKQYAVNELIGGEYLVKNVFGGQGQSGQGVVYLVISPQAPKPYVIKTIQQKVDSNNSTDFMKECKLWINLGKHPHIVQAYWVRWIDDQIFIAAEYIETDSEERNTVTNYLRDGSVPITLVIKWAIQFCKGMTYANTKGLKAHRDIKPDNIMITYDGNVKITDFGLARTFAETGNNSIAGTLPYISPEQFYRGISFDHRADIYSFGIVLYELASNGMYPYKINPKATDPVLEFSRLHTTGKVIPLKSILFPIIEKCLLKEPAKRYQSFSELQIAIEAIAVKNKVPLPPISMVESDEQADLYAKAQSYTALGEPELALEFINSYVQKYQNYHDGWTEKSRIHLEMKDANLAIVASNKSIELNPYNSHPWNNLGVAYSQLKDWNKARSSFLNAIEIDSGNTGAMMQLAKALFELGDYENATKWLLHALNLRPQKSTLRFNATNLSAMMLQKGHASAHEVIEKLVELEPENTTNLINLALSYQSNRLEEKALEHFLKAEKLLPNDEFVLKSVADLYSQLGKVQEAVKYWDKVILVDNNSEKAYTMKAQLLFYGGKYLDAVSTLQTGIKLFPQKDSLWFILATIHERGGDFSSALAAAINCRKLLIRKGETSENLDMVNELISKLKRRH
jgi:serine/threonine protein kinase